MGDHLHLAGLEVQIAADVAHQLLAGVVVDRHRDVDAVLVVAVDALDRRHAVGPHAVLRGAAEPGAQDAPSSRACTTTPSTLIRGSPATSAGPGRCAGGRSVTVTRPRTRAISSGPAASARASISRTFGSWSAIAVALVVAQREHVQQQRLLDLGRVEQVAVALRRDLRVVGQHDRRAEHRVVGVGGQDREDVDLVTRGDRCLGRRPGGERRGEAAPGRMRDQMRRQQRGAQRAATIKAGLDRRSCCGRTWRSARARRRAPSRPFARARGPRRRRSARSRRPGPTAQSSAIGPSSTRRSTPWWRSPLGSRNATVPEIGASGPHGSSTTCIRARSNVCGPPAA